MKILLLLLVLFTPYAYAEDCTSKTSVDEVISYYDINTNVPNHLKGATITIRRADGKESTVPAEKFKVVPRVQQYIIKTAAHLTKVSCSTNNPEKNRISILAGRGTTGELETSTSGSTVEVSSKIGAVGGLQYQRMISKRISLGIQGQTNKTGLGMIGLDF